MFGVGWTLGSRPRLGFSPDSHGKDCLTYCGVLHDWGWRLGSRARLRCFGLIRLGRLTVGSATTRLQVLELSWRKTYSGATIFQAGLGGRCSWDESFHFTL